MERERPGTCALSVFEHERLVVGENVLHATLPVFLFHLGRDFRRRCRTDCSGRQRLADEGFGTREDAEAAVVAMHGGRPIRREQDVERQVVRLEEALDCILLYALPTVTTKPPRLGPRSGA